MLESTRVYYALERFINGSRLQLFRFIDSERALIDDPKDSKPRASIFIYTCSTDQVNAFVILEKPSLRSLYTAVLYADTCAIGSLNVCKPTLYRKPPAVQVPLVFNTNNVYQRTELCFRQYVLSDWVIPLFTRKTWSVSVCVTAV